MDGITLSAAVEGYFLYAGAGHLSPQMIADMDSPIAAGEYGC